ncbi:hypothetical protein P046_01107 [Brucella suis 06-997-1672]|nr:hypothetical protein C000_02618 [Brucella suis F7/06-1]ENT48598.1 hypothetical protein B988_02614 [Brucella suis F7/06-2]ERU17777.1 hypothetical protein P046_01105 [Brucella suis 06-997-1672]ERU17778.1 hypothetical protein P046_01106 [Brucella suis 06-997-1672]ERU17779.1 hypothetical protein P046_01107 [Brucella suis 06-997-1672]
MKSLFIASTMVLMAFPAFAESTTVKMYIAIPVFLRELCGRKIYHVNHR